MHQCIISLGSNHQRKEKMAFARQQLSAAFPSIRFTTEQDTEPVACRNRALFSNQMAVFVTEADAEEVRRQLKEMEKAAGRCPGDKIKEKICLDLDLLIFDREVLKPADLERDYVKLGLEELKKNIRI